MAVRCIVALAALTQLLRIPLAHAILPTAAIDVHYESSAGHACENRGADGSCYFTLLASQGNFGHSLAMEAKNNEITKAYFPPNDDPLLCLGSPSTPEFLNEVAAGSKFTLVVPRGVCTFEQKALNAQKLGASGIVIYGTLESRYHLNTTQTSLTTDDIIYPAEFHDYDCKNAVASIPLSDLSFNPLPYNGQHNDPIVSGTAAQGNLCAAQNVNFKNTCSSEKCLLTGKVTGNSMEACCAWDKHVWLFRSNENVTDIVTIPAVYITMAEADTLISFMRQNLVTMTLYKRYYPTYNISSVLIWLLGVFVAGISAYLSASEIRHAKAVGVREIQAAHTDTIDNYQSQSTSSNNAAPRNTTQGYEQVASTNEHYQDETLELDASHACGFIVFATGGLLFLFFFKVYNVVKVLYTLGCCAAIFEIIFCPMYYWIAKKMNCNDRMAFHTNFLELGTVTYIQLAAFVTSLGLSGVWLFLSFTQRRPDSILFFWVMQDVMGASMCILFLSTMKLNSIKVASILLTAAFFYDIFFVFGTPYLTKDGKSIMVDVATSGGPPKADPSWCEKYPNDKDCQGGNPLPMLLTVPKLGDYVGGSSLLGLGDIVLPGLLLSFAARYDEAKRFVGSVCGDRAPDENCTNQKGTYFLPLVVAYAIGLAMANAAVFMMKMGQPALLYLVPCCLGTFIFLGWKRGELNELWKSPKVLSSTDEFIYGTPIDDTENGTILESQ